MKRKNWIACVQDRGKWKEVAEKGKTFNQEEEEEACLCTVLVQCRELIAIYYTRVQLEYLMMRRKSHLPFIAELSHKETE